MGLLSSLFSGVAGLNASGSTISIIGDNIANSNTSGFKAARAEFVDVLSGNLGGAGGSGQIGAGSRLANVAQTFTQGSLESTGVTTDLAVDGGGFFIVEDAQGTFYSRAGIFRLDSSQVLVNPENQRVQGFGINPNGTPNGALGNIDLSTVSSQPAATGLVDVNVNLDPNDDGVALVNGGLAFDHTDPVATSEFQTGIRIFDSLGNARNISVYFAKHPTTDNLWHWIAGANRSDIDVAAYGGSFAAATATPATQFFPVQSGYLDFTTEGLLNVENTTANALRYDLDGDETVDDIDGDGTANELADDFLDTPGNAAGWHFAGGATAGQTISFSFGTNITTEGGTGADATTQYGGTTTGNNFPRFVNQNGFSAGDLQGVNIDDDGFVTGLFSNGQSVRLAQVALARFPNVNGLSRVGRNNFVETNTTGNPVIGSPNQQGFGQVRAGFLELSNTDLAEEFVRLILAQRSFQANTRTISTTNELLAQLVQLGQ